MAKEFSKLSDGEKTIHLLQKIYAEIMGLREDLRIERDGKAANPKK
ncbi:MAG: hypothetical protein WBV94_29560 [Blastocatellia bacterium]